MRKSFILTTMIVMALVLPSPRVFSDPPEPLYESSQVFIQRFFELCSQQDFKTIYKDLTSSRFKTNEDFAGFESALSQIYQKFGKVRERKSNILLREDHEKLKLQFFRLEYVVVHEKGETIQRVVLMKTKDQWVIDGLGIATTDDALFALGNLYNFDYAKWLIQEQTIWSQPKFRQVWKDLRTDQIEQSLAGQVKTFLLGANDFPRGVVHQNYKSDGSFNNE